jgi:hypothetical protein
MIALSQASTGTGAVDISITTENAVYGEHFTTIPAAFNGKITLAVEQGIEHLQVKVIPINNESINTDRVLQFTITDAKGAVEKGTMLQHTLTITDDELAGISKGYTSTGGGWTYKRNFSYREDGKVSKVYWEQSTPGYLGGTYTYHYSENGTLVKMTESAYTETIYTTENGRIIKSEKFTDGVLKQYTLYGYDDAGNIGEVANYYRQPDGQMKLGLVFVYLYFTDGNLYKQLTYNPGEDGEEYTLISTRTYENYLPNDNAFPIELLPNVSSQPNLPGSYRVEENGRNILYTFFYEFDNEGRVTKRTASSPQGSEVTNYKYY